VRSSAECLGEPLPAATRDKYDVIDGKMHGAAGCPAFLLPGITLTRDTTAAEHGIWIALGQAMSGIPSALDEHALTSNISSDDLERGKGYFFLRPTLSGPDASNARDAALAFGQAAMAFRATRAVIRLSRANARRKIQLRYLRKVQ
jgi:hypothetical protein